MAVYGKSRKRARPSSSTPLFSSDDEAESNATDELTPMVADLSTTTKDQLLPSAAFSPNRISPRKPTSDLFEDPLTTSPRKLKALMGSFGSPRAPKPKNLAEELTSVARENTSPRRKPNSAEGAYGSDPATPYKSGRSSADSLYRKSGSIPSTPVTPKEKDAWTSLFENIATEEQPQACQSSEEEQDDTSHLKQISAIYEDLHRSPLIVENTRATVTRKIPIQSSKSVYGDERSFLLHENDESTTKDDEGAHIDSGPEEVVNINDLRTLGMSNREKDQLSYILDGIVFKRSSDFQSAEDHTILLATLLDILLEKELSSVLETNSVSIQEKLVGTYTKVMKHKGTQQQLLQWLVSLCIYNLMQCSRNVKALVCFVKMHIFDILDTLGKTITDTPHVTKITSKRISKAKELFAPTEMQLKFLMTIIQVPEINNWELFEKAGELYSKVEKEEHRVLILGYFEEYLGLNLFFESLGVLSQIISQRISSIQHLSYSETDSKILNISMILHAYYGNKKEVREVLYNNYYIHPMLETINNCLASVKSRKATKRETQALSVLLTLLVHFPEFVNIELREFDAMNRNLELVLSMEKSSDSLVQHCIGYSLIFAGHMKARYNDKIQIDKTLLLNKLVKYNNEVDGFQQKIAAVSEALT